MVVESPGYETLKTENFDCGPSSKVDLVFNLETGEVILDGSIPPQKDLYYLFPFFSVIII